MSDDRRVRQGARSIEVSRVVEASAEETFRFLSDPANHVHLDTSGMLRGAASGSTITSVGDVFVMNMFNEVMGDHQVENHVVVYEADRAIGWAPAEPGKPSAGHTWIWRLEPYEDGGTAVTHVYDWSRFTHTDVLDHLPVIDSLQMQESVDRLAAALTRRRPR